MKHFRHARLFLLPVLALIPSIFCAQALEEPDRKWLVENTKAPESSMMFVMKFSESLFDLDRTPTDLPDLPEDVAGLRDYISKNPEESRGYVGLFRLLQKAGQAQEAENVLNEGLLKIGAAIERDTTDYDLRVELTEIFHAVNNIGRVRMVLNYWTSENPEHAEGLACLALYDAVMMDLETARRHSEAAYALDPGQLQIYVAMSMVELYTALQKMNADGDQPEIPLSTAFFEKAIQEHPEVAASGMALHGLELFKVFFELVIAHSEHFQALEPFVFKMEPEAADRYARSKAYFEKMLKKGFKNDYYLRKCLLLADIAASDLPAARKQYASAKALPSADSDLFRLMAIGEVTQVRYDRAAAVMEECVAADDKLDDRLLLARFQAEADAHAAAYTAIAGYSGLPSGESLIARMGYGIRAGKAAEVGDIARRLAESGNFEGHPGYRYFAGVLALLDGQRATGVQHLKAVGEGYYQKSAAEILERFDR